MEVGDVGVGGEGKGTADHADVIGRAVVVGVGDSGACERDGDGVAVDER